MDDLIRVMKALSDSNRIKLLKMLQHRVLCVCEIQAALDIAQPTVSKHLRILEDAGLVAHKKQGLWVNYRLADGCGSPYAASLLGSMTHWLEEDPAVQKVLKRLPAIRREDLCKK